MKIFKSLDQSKRICQLLILIHITIKHMQIIMNNIRLINNIKPNLNPHQMILGILQKYLKIN